MKLGEYDSLFRHMEWADALTWRAVQARPEASQDDWLIERLHHLHAVQWAYLCVWIGEPARPPERGAFANAAAVREWARQYYERLRPFRDGLEAGALAATLELPWAAQVASQLGSAPGPATLGESMLQVALHTGYHRGQVATRLRQRGGEPPLTDFIVWLWQGRPEARW